jgi:hypothetical protein
MRRTWSVRPTLPEEVYTVTIEHDAATAVVVRERWRKDGLDHREHGPALIVRDAITGVVVNEKWCKKGHLDRSDGPADIMRRPDGRIYYSAWYRNGEKILPGRPSPGAADKSHSRQAKPRSSGPTG